jgi:serine/threonine protein kinase/tetratricopeptide (TPR) repeat protein
MPAGPPVDDDPNTVVVGDAPGAPTNPPDETTLLLPSPTDSANASDTPDAVQQRETPHLLPGESLAGRFTILRFIARGGMGAVYEADDGMLRTRVALKVIGGRIATDRTELERFRREVLLSRRVGHPNVCRVYELYEVKTAAGVPIHFLSMEFLEGETLASRIARKGRLPTEEMLPLVRQMCDGLAAAHAEGVIHRDFKSSNVMLVPRAGSSSEPTTEATRVVITDFGVARALDVESERLSGGAGILGTPDYMAPEQVTGGDVMPATDVYALGVVLYEMATGKLPFADKTPLASAARRLNEAPPRPEVAAPGLDKQWAATITRCMARQPDRRFQSAQEVSAALDRPRRPRRLWLAGSLGVLVLLLGAFALVRYRTSLRPQERPRIVVPTASRPVLAILGFRDELPSPQLSWLPTAVSELLAHELSAAETSLRVIPTDRVAKVRRSLGVFEDDVADEKALLRMQGLLAANVLVSGSLMSKPSDPSTVTLSVDVVDAQTRQPRATLKADIGPNGAKLPEAVVEVAAQIRNVLGVFLSQEEEAALSSSRVQSPDAMQAYAQGVMKLRSFDYEGARAFFEAARAGAPNFLDAQLRVLDTWEFQDNGKKVREAIEYLRARKSGLTPRLAAVLNEKYSVFGPDDKGSEAATAVFDAMPDDVEIALGMAAFGRERPYSTHLSPRTTLAMVQRLRQLPEPASRDLRLDIAEAGAAGGLGDAKRAQELLEKAAARAKELGARTELAWILRTEWKLLYATERRGTTSLGPLLEAERLFSQVGELDEVADTKFQKSLVLSLDGATEAALAANDEAASLFRKLGDRTILPDVFLQSAHALFSRLELVPARRKLDEARAELEAAGEPLTGDYFGVQAELDFEAVDLAGLRRAAQGMRASSTAQGMRAGSNEISALVTEGRLLRLEDRRSEARESLLAAAKLLEERKSPMFTSRSIRLEVCSMDCDDGNTAKGLACLAEFSPPASLGDDARYSTLLSQAKCKRLANDFAGAERDAREGVSIADRRHYSPVGRLYTSLQLMQAQASQGKNLRKTISTLRAELAALESKHAKRLAFEVALVLGGVELQVGRPEGRPRLLKLEQDANALEYFRVARLAHHALERDAAFQRPATR